MIIGGLQKFSMLDYPGHLAAIIFTQGCNFRCHFCYNPMLVWPKSDYSIYASASNVNKSGAEAIDQPVRTENRTAVPEIAMADLFVFLERRVGKLEGVVITGGEPTLHPDLPDFLRRLRVLGFKIKLDTNGTNPEMLTGLIRDGLVDYIAMDVKTSPKNYNQATGVEVALDKILNSITITMESGLPYEFRTTAVPGLVEAEDIEMLGKILNGADKWFLQRFKADVELVDKQFERKLGHTENDLAEMLSIAKRYVKFCELR